MLLSQATNCSSPKLCVSSRFLSQNQFRRSLVTDSLPAVVNQVVRLRVLVLVSIPSRLSLVALLRTRDRIQSVASRLSFVHELHCHFVLEELARQQVHFCLEKQLVHADVVDFTIVEAETMRLFLRKCGVCHGFELFKGRRCPASAATCTIYVNTFGKRTRWCGS